VSNVPRLGFDMEHEPASRFVKSPKDIIHIYNMKMTSLGISFWFSVTFGAVISDVFLKLGSGWLHDLEENKKIKRHILNS
jgi:hypothetical protein